MLGKREYGLVGELAAFVEFQLRKISIPFASQVACVPSGSLGVQEGSVSSTYPLEISATLGEEYQRLV